MIKTKNQTQNFGPCLRMRTTFKIEAVAIYLSMLRKCSAERIRKKFWVELIETEDTDWGEEKQNIFQSMN